MLAWQCGSTDFEITTEFLWIHVGQRGQVEVENFFQSIEHWEPRDSQP